MRRCFVPRQWRLPRWVYFLMFFELPFTVANLALFGIASPNLYREILWAEGGKMGFNSDPTTILYAAANYRPIKKPIVWDGFNKKKKKKKKKKKNNTQYHLVIGVVCTFFWLVKVPMWFLHVFYPVLSLLLHIALLILWAYGIHVQTAPDRIDPERINNGAPWYITKSCDIVDDKLIRSYCMQAKSSFAVSIIMLAIYAFHVLLAGYSLYPTEQERTEYETKRAEKKAQKEKWAAISSPDNEMTAEEQWQHMWELQQLPRTPGTAGALKSPMTPRTRAFESLSGVEAGYQQQQQQQAYYQPQYQYPAQPQYQPQYQQPVQLHQQQHYQQVPQVQYASPVQYVSPVEEQAEYIYPDDNKTKGAAY
ncbi:hypothetical protein BS50DRAFT_631918 [Corynespora cassiicola Philippines]|uniref:MARVEL domain-containing protein n=1 Tax=Corynespora cassiicola Philippines TaxID=1448308 RepID=A0A2T2NXZ8_CORCC|nr:hypothetical protein BS50DRAFT_631918 [Corynespora cassiicola Philippines]